MPDVIFIGDAVTAAGFRLAGVPSFSPDADDLEALVADQRASCRVMILTGEALAGLADSTARSLNEADSPLLAVVPDARGAAPVPDLEAEVRRALGIEV